MVTLYVSRAVLEGCDDTVLSCVLTCQVAVACLCCCGAGDGVVDSRKRWRSRVGDVVHAVIQRWRATVALCHRHLRQPEGQSLSQLVMMVLAGWSPFSFPFLPSHIASSLLPPSPLPPCPLPMLLKRGHLQENFWYSTLHSTFIAFCDM